MPGVHKELMHAEIEKCDQLYKNHLYVRTPKATHTYDN